MLSNISFLHQTTTSAKLIPANGCCQISLFYIKPQPFLNQGIFEECCQISLFYIKPQLANINKPTTNCCQISLFYIKPQLGTETHVLRAGCQISLFYIKPQLSVLLFNGYYVVKYLFSTSNHNLYTTSTPKVWLSNISFLHQTTTSNCFLTPNHRCQISLFYIKPQRNAIKNNTCNVVKYLFSTSNHNFSVYTRRLYLLSNISFLHQTTTQFG